MLDLTRVTQMILPERFEMLKFLAALPDLIGIPVLQTHQSVRSGYGYRNVWLRLGMSIKMRPAAVHAIS